MELELKSFTLKLKHTFGISRESYDTQDTLIVALSLQGKIGYGEATSNPYYGITLEHMLAEIEKIRTLTDKPFGVNLSMIPELGPPERTAGHSPQRCPRR